ncbi:hypothetical protein BDW02DRAFT_606122 [Decorospora gaudefroyi]|uniref:Uncharacterized protein n=1 Tax=Decorospora gaudefroyi TaxID=184978 RepID=A0A6A5K5F3_9PLEO|nr:hypothetical protein BDW02DRAFT_606122 [Decorospora gaudefroyi]
MPDKLMDTEPGGEQTQYEGIHTFIDPHAKQAGQLSDSTLTITTTTIHHPSSANPPNTDTTPSTTLANPSSPSKSTTTPNTQGVSAADKIRYGQSIQEGGMGGQTTSASGEAKTGGAFGGGVAAEEEEQDGGGAVETRREQGYGGERDMDRGVGA